MNIITSEHVPPGQAFLINRNWVHFDDPVKLGPLDTRRWPRFLAFILGRPAPRLPYRRDDQFDAMLMSWYANRLPAASFLDYGSGA